MDNLKNFFHDCVDDFNDSFSGNSPKQFRILQWNVRGLNDLNKFDEVLEFLDSLRVQIDVIVLGETWLKNDNCSLINIHGFRSVFSCRESSSGGLAVFVRSSIMFTTVENVSYEGFHHIHVKLQINGTHIDVHGVYRPPCFDFNNFHTMLESWLSLSPPNRSVFIVGDFNVPVNLSGNNVVGRYKNLLESYGFICTNTFVTRPASMNILDHVVCNFNNASRVQNDTIFNNCSDHLPIISCFEMALPANVVPLTKKIVNHCKLNHDFAAYVSNIERIEDVSACLESVTLHYNFLLEKYTTTVTKTVKIKGTQCPWMNLGLWQLIKLKNKYLKKVKRNPSDIHVKTLFDHLSKKSRKIEEKL